MIEEADGQEKGYVTAEERYGGSEKGKTWDFDGVSSRKVEIEPAMDD